MVSITTMNISEARRSKVKILWVEFSQDVHLLDLLLNESGSYEQGIGQLKLVNFEYFISQNIRIVVLTGFWVMLKEISWWIWKYLVLMKNDHLE